MKWPALLRRDYFPRGRARVAVFREPHQNPIRQHRHEFLELAVVLSGEAVHVTGQFRHPIVAGDVLVISRHRPHGYERTRDLNLLNILVREEALPRLTRDLRRLPGFHPLFALESLRWSQHFYASRLHLNAADLAQLNEWAGRLEEETLRSAQGGRLLAEAYLTLILGLLVRCHGRTSRRTPPSETGAGLGRLLSWIEMHLAEPLDVPLLARQARMSLRSFHRHFRVATGLTPQRYVQRQRLVRAKEILASDSAPRIAEIAAQCGYEDSNYFTRAFRAETGMSPRTFRRTPAASRRMRSARR